MEIKIDGIKITNPDKIIYPKQNIKKVDVIKYYKKVAEKMLPYVKDRPISAIKVHGTIDGEKFFKKHPTTERENVNIFNDNGEEYFYIKTAKDIIYQAQMGTLEFHIWGSKIKSINRPDLMVFDLDPDEKVSLEQLRQGVLHLKEVLDKLNLKCYLKTSGGKGYHIVVPFKKSKNWEIFSEFSKNVAKVLEQSYPKLYTTNIRKKDRRGKIFIDYLRNDKGSTCVCPFSLRARDDAPISFPITWTNLYKITPNDINIKNCLKYLNKINGWEFFSENNQLIK